MFKSIPKSNISKRSFNVYKLWNTNESEYPIIKVYNETGLFDDNSDKSEGYFVHTLYNSLNSPTPSNPTRIPTPSSASSA